MTDKILAGLRRQNWVKHLINNANVYIVGGCVRDAILNKPIKDVDIVVEGKTMSQLQDLLKDYGKLIPGGSILTTLGTNKKSTLSNCYVTPSPEDKIPSIFDSVKTTAIIYSNRGGCGLDGG